MYRLIFAPLACLGLVVAAGSGWAQTTLYDSAGFEQPRFTTSPFTSLEGQDPTQGPWQASGGTSPATIQTSVVQAGTQAVQFNRTGAGADTYYGVLKSVTSPSVVTISWDMRVAPGSANNPFFGVNAFDRSSGAAHLAGGLGVDAGTGNVLYTLPDTGDFAPTGTTVTLNAFHNYRMVLNYTSGTGNGTYDVFVDNALAFHSPGFSDAAVGNGIRNFTDAPIAALATTAAGVNTATGTAFFDNYRITVGAVPEPTSLALAGVGLVGLAWRRLRRPARS